MTKDEVQRELATQGETLHSTYFPDNDHSNAEVWVLHDADRNVLLRAFTGGTIGPAFQTGIPKGHYLGISSRGRLLALDPNSHSLIEVEVTVIGATLAVHLHPGTTFGAPN